jgi:hypothetical protein
MKWVISMNNLVYLPLLHPGRQGRNLITFSEKNLLHIFPGKENLISLLKKCLIRNQNRRIKLKNKINTVKIDDSEKEDINRILQSGESFDSSKSSDIDIFNSDEYGYRSASEFSDNNVFKIGCNDSRCKNIKTCNVLTKAEEQEYLLITLISKIENTNLNEEYLKKLKKTMTESLYKPIQSKISLDETLERFSKQKSKVVTVSDLQH